MVIQELTIQLNLVKLVSDILSVKACIAKISWKCLIVYFSTFALWLSLAIIHNKSRSD